MLGDENDSGCTLHNFFVFLFIKEPVKNSFFTVFFFCE